MSFSNKTNCTNSKLKTIFKDSFVSDKIVQFELKSEYQQRFTKNRTDLTQTIIKKRKLKQKMQKFNENLNFHSDETNQTNIILEYKKYIADCDADHTLAINHIALSTPFSPKIQSTASKLFVSSTNSTSPIIVIKKVINALLQLPFLTSVNGFGCITLASSVVAPRFLTQNLLYPVFRLTFGTLYPAYASYKAVRNKDVKDNVSMITFLKYEQMKQHD